MANHTLKLAEFCSEITFEKLEPKVVERAKLIISDCVAAILGGIVEIEVQQLLKVRCGRKSAIRQVPIIGLRKWAEPSQAALLHGLAGTVLEMDEGHQFAKGHPGMHV
ncbi:MAG: MmgE/PrpD family protein, partial [Candidatus Puniceispirillaceae bacterium]